jgi:hypothetical protein
MSIRLLLKFAEIGRHGFLRQMGELQALVFKVVLRLLSTTTIHFNIHILNRGVEAGSKRGRNEPSGPCCSSYSFPIL